MTLTLTADASPGAPPATATPVPTPAPVCDILTMSPLNNALNRTGSWTSGCPSTYRFGRNARYYKLQVQEREEIRITLSSSVDPWLVVRQGNSKTGTILHQNNDGGGTLGQTSRVTETLAVGFYTLELTTVARNVTGTYNLLIEVVEPTPTPTPTPLPTQPTPVPTPTPTLDPTANCVVQTINFAYGQPVTVGGQWSYTCKSSNRVGMYAKFYRIRVPFRTEVEINVLSSRDSHLNLLDGTGPNGAVLHSDDNGGEGNNARIKTTLIAKTFILEVTPSRHNYPDDFTVRIRLPQVTPTGLLSRTVRTRYQSLLDFNPTVIVNQTARHYFKAESIGGVRYNSFAKHQNSMALNNADDVVTQYGRVTYWSAISHLYQNDVRKFGIYSYPRDETVHNGSLALWGGTLTPAYGLASTEYLYRADRETYFKDSWSFGICGFRGCSRSWADTAKVALWGGTG